MPPYEALKIARERGLDLVEVAPEARPPVCKIMDYGKLRYDQSKRSAPKPKFELKTITLRPKTSPHDLETKLKHARKFLERGDKVRFQVRMRGRERARPGMWADALNEILTGLADIATVIQRPQQEGRGIFAMVEPLKGAVKPQGEPKPKSKGKTRKSDKGSDEDATAAPAEADAAPAEAEAAPAEAEAEAEAAPTEAAAPDAEAAPAPDAAAPTDPTQEG